MKYVVYKLTNSITGKSYIGKTCDIKGRLKKHKTDTHCIYLHRAICKYGLDKFVIEILANIDDDEEEAFRLEEKFIIEFKTLKPYGYNLLEKDGVERKLSKTSLRKLAKSLQGRTDLVRTRGKFIGVRTRPGINVFETRIRCDGVRYQRYFPSEIEAAEAYDKMAIYLYGISARINFVDNVEIYVKENLKTFAEQFRKQNQ